MLIRYHRVPSVIFISDVRNVPLRWAQLSGRFQCLLLFHHHKQLGDYLPDISQSCLDLLTFSHWLQS